MLVPDWTRDRCGKPSGLLVPNLSIAQIIRLRLQDSRKSKDPPLEGSRPPDIRRCVLLGLYVMLINHGLCDRGGDSARILAVADVFQGYTPFCGRKRRAGTPFVREICPPRGQRIKTRTIEWRAVAEHLKSTSEERMLDEMDSPWQMRSVISG
jgi:hypothetical protein